MSQTPGASVIFKDVTVRLDGVTILDNVSVSVPPGMRAAIVGPNGAGKTTFLLALLGQVPHSGAIRTALGESGAVRIGYVPQRLAFDRGLPVTALEFMLMGRQRLPLWLGKSRAHAERARGWLAAVEAGHLERRRLGALSGGEAQRVLLALALQEEPDLLVLDEPAAGVDLNGEHVFCELLERLRHDRGFTQLMVSHDLATVTRHSDWVICLNRQVVAEGPPRQALTRGTLAAIYGPHMGLADVHELFHHKDCDGSCRT